MQHVPKHLNITQTERALVARAHCTTCDRSFKRKDRYKSHVQTCTLPSMEEHGIVDRNTDRCSSNQDEREEADEIRTVVLHDDRDDCDFVYHGQCGDSAEEVHIPNFNNMLFPPGGCRSPLIGNVSGLASMIDGHNDTDKLEDENGDVCLITR